MAFTPIGLVEGEYKVRTTSTAMYPTYETKNLGLNQFTVYSVPGWMSGYNEDMRKIDRYSTSIGAYIEKNLDEQDAEHELLHKRINNTVSMIAYEAKRIDANTSSIAAFRVDQERQEVEFDRRITEAQTDLEKQIADGVKGTTSYIAYVDRKIDKYQATTTTSYMWTSQRLHTVEDEIKTIKETETGLATKVTSNETEINKLKLTTSALDTKQNEIIDKVNEHTTKIAEQGSEISSLKVTETIQDDRLAALNTQVQSNTNNIARLGGGTLEYFIQTHTNPNYGPGIYNFKTYINTPSHRIDMAVNIRDDDITNGMLDIYNCRVATASIPEGEYDLNIRIKFNEAIASPVIGKNRVLFDGHLAFVLGYQSSGTLPDIKISRINVTVGYQINNQHEWNTFYKYGSLSFEKLLASGSGNAITIKLANTLNGKFSRNAFFYYMNVGGFATY